MKRVTLLVALVVLAFTALAETPRTANVVVTIKGMHCDGCAKGITAMLKRTEGVIAAEVSFEKREADVRYDPAITTTPKIVETIENLGYQAAVKE